MGHDKQTGNAEQLLGMAAIASRIHELMGHKPSRSTLWRWHLTGRLDSKRIGSRIYATESAIRAMLATDETHNRGTASSRGQAAAARLATLINQGAVA